MESLLSRVSIRLPAPARRLLRLAVTAIATAGLVAAATPVSALPKVQKVVSPGGIEAWLMELHDAPLITFQLDFAGGSLQDPDGKYGATNMVSYMFNEGAGPYDSAELQRRVTRIGATFGAASYLEHYRVSFSTPSVHKAEAFELLRLAIAAPRLDPEPIARARASYINGIEAAQRDPGSVGTLALRSRMFGTHPMALDWATRKAGYAGITAADIKAHRNRLLARDNLKIAVVGDIDAATLAPLLDRLLASLPAKASLRPVPPPAAAAGSCQLIAMDVPQAVVQFASVTPRPTWRQRLAWWLLDSIIDEGVSAGRLNRELREKRGLVYGIGVNYTDYAAFGLVEGAFSAKMSEVPEALAVLRRELDRMVHEGPTEAEVAAAKPSIVGRTLLGLDTGAAIANLVLDMQVADQPTTYLDDVAGAIEQVTREEVWELAKLVLDPDRLAVGIVGQPGQAGVCDTPVAQK